MATIKVNDATFYYELHGSGQAVVLISGYSADSRLWTPILDSLAKDYQVLIFDNRGVGRTTDDGRALDAELMADDTIALTRALKLHKPHIVGSSMGGTIAQYIGSKYGEEIGKLVPLCTSAKWRQAPMNGLEFLIKLREQGTSIRTICEGIAPLIFGEYFLNNSEAMNLFIESNLADLYPQSLADQKRQFQVLPKFDGRALLKSIKVPTLVVGGKEDILSFPVEFEYLAKNIPNAELVLFDNCAHAVMFEQPLALIKALKDFFN